MVAKLQAHLMGCKGDGMHDTGQYLGGHPPLPPAGPSGPCGLWETFRRMGGVLGQIDSFWGSPQASWRRIHRAMGRLVAGAWEESWTGAGPGSANASRTLGYNCPHLSVCLAVWLKPLAKFWQTHTP